MSIVPQRYCNCCLITYRPPDTPLMSFYATGKYDKPVQFEAFKKNQAMPVRELLNEKHIEHGSIDHREE